MQCLQTTLVAALCCTVQVAALQVACTCRSQVRSPNHTTSKLSAAPADIVAVAAALAAAAAAGTAAGAAAAAAGTAAGAAAAGAAAGGTYIGGTPPCCSPAKTPSQRSATPPPHRPAAATCDTTL